MTKKEIELRLCSVISAINSAVNATAEINDAGGDKTLGQVLYKFLEMAAEKEDLDYADGFNVLLSTLNKETLDRKLRSK